MGSYDPRLLGAASRAINRRRIVVEPPDAAQARAMADVARQIMADRSAKQRGGTGLRRDRTYETAAAAEVQRRHDALRGL